MKQPGKWHKDMRSRHWFRDLPGGSVQYVAFESAPDDGPPDSWTPTVAYAAPPTTHCVSCGAPKTDDPSCSYCGTKA